MICSSYKAFTFLQDLWKFRTIAKGLLCKSVCLTLLFEFSLSEPLTAQHADLKFEKLAAQQGLSNSSVRCILQDSKGFMWFGTSFGLNKYDGFELKIYKPRADDPYSLSNGTINTICEDSTGILWIGTAEGLNRFDPGTEKFNRYLSDPANPHSLSSNLVNIVIQDKSGILWIGTENGGLNRFDPQDSYSFVNYQHDTNYPNSLDNNNVRAICEDRFGAFWVGTFDGFNKFNRQTGQFTRYIPRNISDVFFTVQSIIEARR